MSYLPNHSYFGQYYFNPQWIQATEGNSPSVVYNNVVNFTVGPDGTHYFHQTYSGQFVAPTGPTADSKTDTAPSYDEAVKPDKASGSGKTGSEQKRRKGKSENEKTTAETGVQDKYSSDEDVWATEDEDNEFEGIDSDSSQEDFNTSRSRFYPRARRRRVHNRRDDSPRSPRRETDARSTIVSLVPREFQSFLTNN